MISRIVRVRHSLKTAISVSSNLPNRRFSKAAPDKSFILQGYVPQAARKNSNTRANNPEKSSKAFYSSTTTTSYQPELELNSVQFEKISNDTLESLTDYFDELIEQAAHLPEADVSYGDGVLTVKFGKKEGTYVINRQSPNKQIWLSSPKSGPKRYDFVDGKWVYKHDGKTLHDLLNREIPAIIRNQAIFEKCSYSGMEQYVDRGSPNSFPD